MSVNSFPTSGNEEVKVPRRLAFPEELEEEDWGDAKKAVRPLPEERIILSGEEFDGNELLLLFDPTLREFGVPGIPE